MIDVIDRTDSAPANARLIAASSEMLSLLSDVFTLAAEHHADGAERDGEKWVAAFLEVKTIRKARALLARIDGDDQ